jgi:hypothetical protein
MLVLGVVGVTSLAAYLVGVRSVGLSRGSLGTAVWALLECLGTMVVFGVLNLAVAVGLILAERALTGRAVSLYVLDDIVWVAISLFQAVVYRSWRRAN